MAGVPDPFGQFRRFVAELKAAAPLPVVLLKGNEPFLKERAVEELCRVYGIAPSSITRFGGDEARWPAVVGELGAGLLLGAGRRLVRVDRARAFASQNADAVLEYLKAPAPGVTLALSFDPAAAAAGGAAAAEGDDPEEAGEEAGGKGSPRKGLAALEKRVAEVGAVLTSERPREWLVPRWVGERAGERGKRMGPDAAQTLVNRVGCSLGLLDRYLETLELYVGDRPTIEPQDVQALIGQDRGYDAFQLVQEVAAGRAPEALARMRGRLREARNPQELNSILGLLAWHYRRLYRARVLIDAGRGSEVASVLGIRVPKFADEVIQQARAAPLGAQRRRLEVLWEIDALEKSSAQPEALLADLTVLRLIQAC